MRTITKYFLVGICVTILTIFGHGITQQASHASLPPTPQGANLTTEQQQARTLTERGHQELQAGQPETALQTWQAANQLYRQLNNQEGISGSLINQSLALQAMGQYPRACNTLLQALMLEAWVCQSPYRAEQYPQKPSVVLTQAIQATPNQPVMVIGLHSLGNALRQTGKPLESKIILQQALKMANQVTPTPDTSDILVSLANTERYLYLQAKDKSLTTSEPLLQATAIQTVQNQVRQTLTFYQQASQSSQIQQSDRALEAQLNAFSLLVDLELWTELGGGRTSSILQATRDELRPQVSPLLEQLLQANFDQLPPISAIYGRLNFANSLQQVSQSPALTQQLFPDNQQPLSVALELTKAALPLAEQLDSQRARSYTLGNLGELYRQTNQPDQARSSFQAALAQAQSVQAWDIAYRWQHQLAQLYQQAGNPQQALQFYQAVIATLDQVRGNLLSINPEIQFSFREKVEPVYRDFLRLLLAADNPNLEQVVQTYEKLQIAELENFLQCGKLDFVPINVIQTENSSLAVIHVLNLGSQYEVIVRSTDRSLHHYSASAERVNEGVRALTVNLRDPRPSFNIKQDFQAYAQDLYQLLIAPAREQGYLPNQGTLIFVLDSSLQSIPMSILYNGQRYLVQDYSISNAINSQLRPPKSLKPEELKVLIAGLSEVSPSFGSPDAPANLPPLPEIKAEVTQIKNNAVASKELLNQQFTTVRFQDQVEATRYPVLHISTHGQFSSDPDRTFVLAWDQPLGLQEIKPLLQSRNFNDQAAIELLVLSACETARGDARSTLGIAGVAAQAGARSTVASLWRADATATAELMGKFYQELKAGKSKADALRQAQIDLLQSPTWGSPNYWACFILVGGWL